LEKDLTEDGDVHPHPGPSLRTVTLNCGGLSGSWRAVKEFLPSANMDVLFLQEIWASTPEVQSLRRFVSKHGFRFSHAPGSIVSVSGSAPRQRGGVALLVRNCLRARPAWSWSGTDSQFVGVWVDGWLLASVYACPGHDDVPVFDLLEALIPWMAQVPMTQPWLISGDFNELVPTSKLREGLTAFGGVSVSVEKPTRWEGDRCIDWAITNRPRVCSQPLLVNIHLSDHIPVSMLVEGLGHALQFGSLKRTSSLLCPIGVDRALWERAVLDQWNGSSEVSDFITFVQQNDVINVQEEWDRFQSLLVVTCILGAYSWLACVGLFCPLKFVLIVNGWRVSLTLRVSLLCIVVLLVPMRVFVIWLATWRFGKSAVCWLGVFNLNDCFCVRILLVCRLCKIRSLLPSKCSSVSALGTL
jgi:hypothetical protein